MVADRDQLAEELEHAVALRLLLAVLPIRRALGSRRHRADDLVSTVLGDLRGEIDALVSNYEVRRIG